MKETKREGCSSREVDRHINQGATPAAVTTPTYSAFCIRLVPHLDSCHSLRFNRNLCVIALQIGQFTDCSGLSTINALGTNKLAFRFKVISRAHAEIWVKKGRKV